MGKQLKKSSKGFSLMEVLIAIIVIAIGILGYMALQLASINSNQDGLARSQAIFVSQELGSAIRSNRDYSFDTGEFDKANDSEYLKVDNYLSCTADKPACSGACTIAQQAKVDAWQACRTIKGFTASSTQSSDDLLLNGVIRVGCSDRVTTDSNSCTSGSALSIYTFWAISDKRQDVGQVTIADSKTPNARCNTFASVTSNKVTLTDIGSQVDCIIVDILP